MNPIREADYALIVQKFQESPTLQGAIDIAAIGIMRDGMLRPKEAAEARWSDLQREEDGSGVLNISFSKTDQTGRGDVVYISPTTIAALDEMCDKKQEQGIEATDNLILQMTTKQLRRQIRTACEAAGLEGRYTSKSPRLGMAMDLANAGFSSDAIMQAGRVTTMDQLGPYTSNLLADRTQAEGVKGIDVLARYTRNVPGTKEVLAQWRSQNHKEAASE